MPPLDAKALRSALGRFTTGVTIATCRDAAGRAVGLTCNSFNSLSLDPPLVLWSLRAASPALPAFCATSHFAINILAEGQVELSRRFASGVPDRFAEGQWADGIGGAPVLGGCTAVFECALHSRQDAGDHVLFIGQVERMHEAALPPLLFQAGHYRLLGEIL
jgi:flavin reductase (DIM6/NTAB) family NADH-FMN oxidoreductase RutF